VKIDMNAAVFLGKQQIEVKNVTISSVSEDMVLVKNHACGVCGTDVHIYHGEPGSADVSPPVILGHEYAGEVVEIGSAVKNVKPGDHVTIDPNVYCGTCEYCRNGKKQLCENMQAIGVTRDGGFAEYSIVPESQLFILNKDVSYEVAAMTEPVACCIHGIDLCNIQAGATVCIVGGGAIGLIMLQLARLSGAAKVILSEPNAVRRKAGEMLGADIVLDPTNHDEFANFCGKNNGADVIIECAGNNAAVKSAFELAKKGAVVMLFSVPKVDAIYDLPLFDVFKKELTIKGSFVNPDTHQRAVNLINAGKLNFADIITHRYSISDMEKAIEKQMTEESIKVVVVS